MKPCKNVTRSALRACKTLLRACLEWTDYLKSCCSLQKIRLMYGCIVTEQEYMNTIGYVACCHGQRAVIRASVNLSHIGLENGIYTCFDILLSFQSIYQVIQWPPTWITFLNFFFCWFVGSVEVPARLGSPASSSSSSSFITMDTCSWHPWMDPCPPPPLPLFSFDFPFVQPRVYYWLVI